MTLDDIGMDSANCEDSHCPDIYPQQYSTAHFHNTVFQFVLIFLFVLLILFAATTLMQHPVAPSLISHLLLCHFLLIPCCLVLHTPALSDHMVAKDSHYFIERGWWACSFSVVIYPIIFTFPPFPSFHWSTTTHHASATSSASLHDHSCVMLAFIGPAILSELLGLFSLFLAKPSHFQAKLA